MKQPLAVSIGEPSGVGPDLILDVAERRANGDAVPEFVVFGSASALRERASQLNCEVEVHAVSEVPQPGASWNSRALAIIDVDDALGTPMADTPGRPTAQGAQVAKRAIERALAAVKDGSCNALVTAPIHKANMYDAGFTFPGHTEFLEHLARTQWQATNARAVMMLAGPELRTVPVTVHVPLSAVPTALTSELIEETARVVANDLSRRFGIVRPRLAVSGLNPHAGESGELGTEDDAVILPAVERLRSQGLSVIGPLPADTMFHEEARATYDAALCMYHDQALLPVKTLDFHNTVNVTLGLPFVRTSPDHGTALSLAGTGQANPASFLAACKLARAMAERDAQAAQAA